MGREKGASVARLPTALKERRGTLAKSPTRIVNEPNKAFAVPPVPAHLDADQQTAWALFATKLDTTRITTEDDWAALELLVTLWSQWSQIQDELRAIYKREGCYSYETTNVSGGVMIRIVPQISIAGDLERRMMPLLGRFGMSPADRSRVSMIGGSSGSSADPTDEFT